MVTQAKPKYKRIRFFNKGKKRINIFFKMTGKNSARGCTKAPVRPWEKCKRKTTLFMWTVFPHTSQYIL